jgi:hypothetical protein
MDAPRGGRAPDSPDGATGDRDQGTGDQGTGDQGTDGDDADLVVVVLHRAGRCSMRSLQTQPELHEWSPVRLEQAVTRAWNGGLVFIDPNDDLVAL